MAANLICHVVSLPSLPARRQQGFSVMYALLRRRYFLTGLIASMLSWGSAFTLFTYLRPFLEKISGVSVTGLSILLLALGCAGFVGTWASSRFIRGDVSRALRLPALVMGLVTVGLLVVGRSPLATGALLVVWGAMNTAMSVIWMTWMSQNADDAPEAAGGLMVSAIQASILVGAVLGGLLLDHFSITATLIASVVLACAAVLIVRDGRALLKPR